MPAVFIAGFVTNLLSPLGWAPGCHFLRLPGAGATSHLSRAFLLSLRDGLLSYSEMSHARSGDVKEGKENQDFLLYGVFHSTVSPLLSRCHFQCLSSSGFLLLHKCIILISILSPEWFGQSQLQSDYIYDPKLLVCSSDLTVSETHAHLHLTFQELFFSNQGTHCRYEQTYINLTLGNFGFL